MNHIGDPVSRRLWLDDVRLPPDHTWRWVKTADEAIAALASGTVDEISLDHDLAEEHYEGRYEPGGMYGPPDEAGNVTRKFREKTGYDVVLWMVENNIWPTTIRIHTMNPVGRTHMKTAIERALGENARWIMAPQVPFRKREGW